MNNVREWEVEDTGLARHLLFLVPKMTSCRTGEVNRSLPVLNVPYGQKTAAGLSEICEHQGMPGLGMGGKATVGRQGVDHPYSQHSPSCSQYLRSQVLVPSGCRHQCRRNVFQLL